MRLVSSTLTRVDNSVAFFSLSFTSIHPLFHLSSISIFCTVDFHHHHHICATTRMKKIFTSNDSSGSTNQANKSRKLSHDRSSCDVQAWTSIQSQASAPELPVNAASGAVPITSSKEGSQTLNLEPTNHFRIIRPLTVSYFTIVQSL